MNKLAPWIVAAGILLPVINASAHEETAQARIEGMRLPWQRGAEDFIRAWKLAGPFECTLAADCLADKGGEANARPTSGATGNGAITWRDQVNYADVGAVDGQANENTGSAYAFATISRAEAGQATLALGTVNGTRVWLNGKQIHSSDATRPLTLDEDRIAIDLNAGDNALLIKTHAGALYSARVLAPGAAVKRRTEISPAIVDVREGGFTLVTDKSAGGPPVLVEIVGAGGVEMLKRSAARGERIAMDTSAWPAGAYEARLTTQNFRGRDVVTHLPLFHGDALKIARELAAEAAKAAATSGEGMLLRMLEKMVEDRLGVTLAEATGNPWRRIHSPLMEFQELMLERQGKTGRVRKHGFVRIAYLDETDNTPQFARVYLPANYEAGKKWPLVVQLHGFNGANPEYWDWWSADSRHGAVEPDLGEGRGVIFMEPHGRGNTQYLHMGDRDVLRVIAEAKRMLSVDENRVYLTGDSMGGWGVWNVSTRHPDSFAAIAPVFGGVDYHSQLSAEEIARLSPAELFARERQSSWSMADSLINLPIFVHHGDRDAAVNVDWSRWGVQLLQRWGYNVRYKEYPGKIHEALDINNGAMSAEWFLQHVRDPDPLKVRIRSAELRNARAYWAHILQAETPLQFMRLDAEIVDRNVIRLDTDNVLDVSLTPPAIHVDHSKPVRVVWNGVAQDLRPDKGVVRLTSSNYRPAPGHKRAALPGGTNDFINTPFAIVIGTSSKDPEMSALIKTKADGYVDAWRTWQKFPPRVFLDTEISDADIARYSLILLGGADANRVTAKLAAKLPLKITADRIVLDGKEFKTRNSAVQMLYPNPRNADRYVLVAAGQGADGFHFVDVNPTRLYEHDYVINDGRAMPPRERVSPLRTLLVVGMFDHGWRYRENLAIPGDADIRARGRQLHRPKSGSVDPKILAQYAGRYRVTNGPLVELRVEDRRLIARVQGDDAELLPESEIDFTVPRFSVRLSFLRDAAGKVTGFEGFDDGNFEGQKLE